MTLKKSYRYHSHDGRNRNSLSARLLAMRIRTKETLISKNYLRSQKRSKQSESVKQKKQQARSSSDHAKTSNLHPKEGSSARDVKQATIKKATPGINGFAMTTSLLAAKAI